MKMKSFSLILLLTFMNNVYATDQFSAKKEDVIPVLLPVKDEPDPLTKLRLYVIATTTTLLNKNQELKDQLADLSLTPHKNKTVTLNSFTMKTALTIGTDSITDIFASLKNDVFTILSSILAENAALEAELAQATSIKETPLPDVQNSPAFISVPTVSPPLDLPGLDELVPWKDLKSMTMLFAHDLLFENRELRKQFKDRPVPIFNNKHTFLPFTSPGDEKFPRSLFVSKIFSTLKKNVLGFLSGLIDENKELKSQLDNEKNTPQTRPNEKDQAQPNLTNSLGDATSKPAAKEEAEEKEKAEVKPLIAVSSGTLQKLIKPLSRRSSSQRLVSTGNARYDNFVKSLIWQGNDLDTLEPHIKAKLAEITGPQFTITALEESLIKQLNAAPTLEQASSLLRSQTNSPAVLRSTTHSRRELFERHDSNLAQQRLDTAAHEKAQSVAKYTQRFLIEGKIMPGWGDSLDENSKEALGSEISQIVVDCYDGVIPNFCGKMEGPLEDFILLAATQTSWEKFRAAMAKARTNIQWEKAQQRDELREANAPLIASKAINIDHHMMFSTTNTSVMENIHLPETVKKMKLHKPEHVEVREKFELLISTPTATGFVCVPLADQDHYMHLTMKAFWLRKSLLNPLTDQYDPIFLTANHVAKGIIEEFVRLTQGEYVLWLLRISGERYFFAIPRNPRLTVISLTLHKGDKRLNGYILQCIESAQKLTTEMVC
jgi:hypothetical protein